MSMTLEEAIAFLSQYTDNECYTEPVLWRRGQSQTGWTVETAILRFLLPLR